MTARRQPNPSTEFMDDAACRRKVGVFFPNSTATEAARAVCRECPVRVPCGAYADAMDPEGVWAGLTRAERRRARRRPA